MPSGLIYLLQNRSFKDHVVKIGLTQHTADERARQIYSGATGVPEPFDVMYACSVTDCKDAEGRVHRTLATYRVNGSREFFHVPPSVARQIIFDVCSDINAERGQTAPEVVVDLIERITAEAQLNDKYEERFGVVESIPIHLIRRSPIGTSSLSGQQIKRISVLRSILLEVFPDSVERWREDFTRDVHPEAELRIWEHIAMAYSKVTQARYLDTAARHEAYKLILMRSLAPSKEVLKRHRLKYLSPSLARLVLGTYALGPKPITVKKVASCRDGGGNDRLQRTPLISAIQNAYEPRGRE